MEQYVGLDASLKETSLCVVDQTGTTVWQGKCASTPESIAAVLAKSKSGEGLSLWLRRCPAVPTSGDERAVGAEC
jgi:hypothetical protein